LPQLKTKCKGGLCERKGPKNVSGTYFIREKRAGSEPEEEVSSQRAFTRSSLFRLDGYISYKYGSGNEQNEDDNRDEMSEDDSWPAAASQGSVGDPDRKKAVNCVKRIAQSWILVLREEFLLGSSPQLDRKGKTYNLRDGVDWLVAHFIVCFQPKNEGCSRLASKRLHG